jgi:transposase
MGTGCQRAWSAGRSAAATSTCHRPPAARGTASARRLRPVHRLSLRSHPAAQGRTEFLAFARYLRALYPPDLRIAIVLDNFSPHLSTKADPRVGDWAAANNVELACVPFYGSWLNRIEAQSTALRYFALNGTDHACHAEQASMIRRYIAWRNRHATDTPPTHNSARCMRAAATPSWAATDAPPQYVEGQLRAIVGVELQISRIDAKAKLSENRSAADVQGVITGLAADGEKAMSLPTEKALRDSG